MCTMSIKDFAAIIEHTKLERKTIKSNGQNRLYKKCKNDMVAHVAIHDL